MRGVANGITFPASLVTETLSDASLSANRIKPSVAEESEHRPVDAEESQQLLNCQNMPSLRKTLALTSTTGIATRCGAPSALALSLRLSTSMPSRLAAFAKIIARLRDPAAVDFVATTHGHELEANLIGAVEELRTVSSAVRVFGSFPVRRGLDALSTS